MRYASARTAPSCDIFNLGSSYFHVPLTTVRRLLNVCSVCVHCVQAEAGECVLVATMATVRRVKTVFVIFVAFVSCWTPYLVVVLYDTGDTLPLPVHPPRRTDDNGSAGHGSSGSTNLSGSRWSRASTRDPLTHDRVNKIPRTGYFVAVMTFDFESTST